MLTVTELDTLSLVPPTRFGRLLADHRWEQGAGLADLAGRTHGRFEAAELAEVEAGRRPLGDEDLALLCGAYGVVLEPGLQPRRTRLVVDLDEGYLASGAHQRLLHPGDLADDVLGRYLGLIVALRGAAPGTAIGLRHDDVEVLANALWIEPEDIEARLELLMSNPRDRIGRRVRRLSRRSVVPAAGILVAATGEGMLVLDRSGDGPDDGIEVRPEAQGATVIALAPPEQRVAERLSA